MRVFLGRCHMTKYVLQIGDDEHSTETMVNKNQIALNNSEHQLNDANKITKLDNIDNIVKNLVAMIEDYNTQNPTSLAYSHKLTLLKDKNVMKCIIKDVGPHDKGGIKLIVDENFRQQEIAHIEELDNNIYSKRLSFLFDGKNRYLIISSRYQQIRSYQTRSDLLVISSSENNATYLAHS